MRIAVISDTHLPRGRRRLPERAVAEIRRADLLLHAGDVSAAAVLDELAALGPPLRGVHGNVDDPVVRARLPARDVVELGAVRIGLVHDAGPAAGRLARLRRRFADCDAVVFGHSHIPLLQTTVEAGRAFAIFNPGSPTDRRRQPRRTMGIATVDGGEIAFEHLALE